MISRQRDERKYIKVIEYVNGSLGLGSNKQTGSTGAAGLVVFCQHLIINQSKAVVTKYWKCYSLCLLPSCLVVSLVLSLLCHSLSSVSPLQFFPNFLFFHFLFNSFIHQQHEWQSHSVSVKHEGRMKRSDQVYLPDYEQRKKQHETAPSSPSTHFPPSSHSLPPHMFLVSLKGTNDKLAEGSKAIARNLIASSPRWEQIIHSCTGETN